jgi:general secretion pathway protein D
MRSIKSLLLAIVLVASLSAREQVNVNFANLEIKDFIKLISKITNTNILISQKVSGTVDFVSSVPIYDDELMGILVSVLETKGFTLSKDGSLYKVIRSTDAAKHNAEVKKVGEHLDGSLMVTQSIKIEGENVDVVAAKVRYLISKTAKLMTMKESNTLLVTDYPKNIETLKEVIKDLAIKQKMIVKVIPIKYASLKKLQTRLALISKSIFNEKIVAQKVKIIADENINALIVVGISTNVKKVESLVKEMDKESSISNGVQIFNLKNSDAKSVLTSLNDIISKQKYKDESMKPHISVSEEINAIIAIGDPLIIKGIKHIIDVLDAEKYQVYVQARILEINKNDAEDLGIKYGFDGATISSSGGLYSLSGNFGGSAVAGTLGSSLATSALGTNLSSGFALGATIDFLETHGVSTSISNPSILCVNNKESSIYVGKTISVSSGSTSNAVSGITNNYKREDVGLTLKIKPRVSSLDKVTLTVEIILENVLDDGSNNINGQPVTSKQEVKTEAILSHGENIIIGGLVKSYDRESVSKVPFLGDIPWIGKWLFSSTSNSIEEDNLVVILTPYVIGKSDKLSQLQEELGTLAKLQKEYDKKIFEAIESRAEEKDESSDKNPLELEVLKNSGDL